MTTNTDTDGGAHVGGHAETGGGDFSGRDRYTTFNTTSEGIQNLLYMVGRLESKFDLYVYKLDKQVDSHFALEQRVNSISNRTVVALLLGAMGTIGLVIDFWIK